jgi:hypothetical protein
MSGGFWEAPRKTRVRWWISSSTSTQVSSPAFRGLFDNVHLASAAARIIVELAEVAPDAVIKRQTIFEQVAQPVIFAVRDFTLILLIVISELGHSCY